MLLRLLDWLSNRPVASWLGIHNGNKCGTGGDELRHGCPGRFGFTPSFRVGRCRGSASVLDIVSCMSMKAPPFKGRWRRHVGPLLHRFEVDTLAPRCSSWAHYSLEGSSE